MTTLKPGWRIKGVYHETCASEGYCPYYFGRDKEGGCRYFMVFRIADGEANGIEAYLTKTGWLRHNVAGYLTVRYWELII